MLMGSLVTQYKIDYVNNPLDAADFAAQCSLVMGIILVAMSLLNLGNVIRYVSFPVMSGFTSAAASLIAMNQIKNAFGFAPQGNFLI